jgi:hypothetical protein
MKDNKVAKHHFWILLALAVVLIPVVIGGATFGVGSAANTERAKIEAEISKLAKAAVKGQRFIDGLKEQEKELQQRRGEVWKKAYEDQTGLIKWPDRLSHLDQLYFGDPIQQIDLVTLQNEPTALLTEYEQKFPKIIEPTQFLGNQWRVVGFVPAPNWVQMPSSEDAWLSLEDLCVRREILKDISAINRFLSRCLPVPGSPPPPPDMKAPDPKAFENDPDGLKTVQAEYAKKKGEYDQKKADYEKLKVDTEKELREYFKPKQGETFGRFISPYWQIDLAVRRSDRKDGKAGDHIFRGRIKNVSVRRQNIDKVEFKVFFQNPDDPATQPAMLKLNHEYLAAGETYEFDDVTSTFSASSLNMVTVEQKLDQKFAPVKRVDRVALCYQSHRYSLSGQTLQMAKFSQPKEGDAAAAMGGPPGMPGMSSTAGGGGPPLGGPPGGFPGGGMGDDRGGPGGMMMMNQNLTKNGLLKARYVHMTEQVRRMPIGVVLIVDQMHVQDVVRAFANSRLRFQNTQFHWQRFHGGLGLGNAMAGVGMPGALPGAMGIGDDRGRGSAMTGPASRSTGGSSTSGGGGPPRGDSGFQPPGGPPFGGPFGGLRGGGAFGGPNWDQQQMPEEGTGNLVELCVYGIASIYEKYPPKPAADAGVTPPATPGPAGDVGGVAPPVNPMGAAPAAPTQPMPPGGGNPPPAAPPPAAPPAGNTPPPANPPPTPPAEGTTPPPPTNTPPAPPPGNNPPPAAPKTNNPPPGNPM